MSKQPPPSAGAPRRGSPRGHTRAQRRGTAGEPIDVVDGIPDRAARAPWWRFALLAALGLVWVAVLVYCWLAGRVDF